MKFSTFGPVCCPRALLGWKEREISSVVKGWTESHPVPSSPSYSIGPFTSDCNFHSLQVWKPFLGEEDANLYQQQVEATVLLIAEEVGLACFLWFRSDTWPLHTLLDTHEGRKLTFSGCRCISRDVWLKLIPWHRLMKPAVSCSTEFLKIFL